MKKLLLSCLILLLAGISAVDAGVNLKNGNFYISYTDFVFDDKFEIERTYNSKSVGTGIFGKGWNSDYETFLVVLPDKSIMVHENGLGGTTRFEALKPDKQNYEAGVQQIVEIAKKLKEVESAASVKELEEKLRKSVEYISKYWQKYRKKGLVETPVIAVGTLLESRQRGFQTIKRTSDGFLRTDGDKKDYFDKNGLLTRIVYKNDDLKTLVYDEIENLKSITDNRGNRMEFFFNSQGTVERIEGKNGATLQRASYKYNDENHLIETTDVEGNNHKYEYDNTYNLKKIFYADNTTMEIEYEAGTNFTKSVKQPDGSRELYEYKSVNDDNYSTTVKLVDAQGKVLRTNGYEYFIKTDEFGNRWTQKTIFSENERKIETDFNKNGQKILIKTNETETRFGYDSSGRLIRMETPEEIIETLYHERLPKIIKVTTTAKPSNKKTWTAFQYDTNGNLIFAENSEGKNITLKYNGKGKIETIQNQNKSLVNIKYRESGELNEITLTEKDKISTLKFEYDKNGELLNVKSPGGEVMADKIRETIANIMILVEIANVDLGL